MTQMREIEDSQFCEECGVLVHEALKVKHWQVTHPPAPRRWINPVNQDAWVRETDGYTLDGIVLLPLTLAFGNNLTDDQLDAIASYTIRATT